jgi:DNA-binding transcriptional regulator YiaG
MTYLQQQLKAARTRLNLTTREAAALLDVSEITFQRWEGQTGFKKPIPFAYWELFLLKTDNHPTHKMIERSPE